MRMHLRRCDMTAVSSLHIVSKSLLTVVQFEDYSIQQRSQSGLIDVATVIAIENTCGYLPHCRELVVVYCNSQSELHVARYEESKTDPLSTKIGEYSSIAGYVSCKIVHRSLLVITYAEKVCIHSLDSTTHFAHPLVSSLAVEKANLRCNVFSHSAGSLFQCNTLALQFISTTAANQIENEWLLLRTSALHEISLRNNREPSMQDVTAVDSPHMDDLHSSQGHFRSHLWTFLPHAKIDSIASAASSELDKMSLYRDELDQYISFAGISCARTGVTSSTKVNPAMNKHSPTLFIAVTKNFELVCYVNQVLQFTKQLPYTSSVDAGSIMLQITNSARNPLLMLFVEHSVLLIDILHSGSVLKEFSNVGACVCASLFHPLAQQLFIIPNNEVGRLNIQSIPGGYVHRVNNTSSDNNSSSNPDSVLSDWFVYELPKSCSNSELTKCRSMDPTGRWREDTRFVIDANAYNDVQWKRQLKQKADRSSSNATETKTIQVESLKRSAATEDSEISAAKRIKVSHSDARINSASGSNSSLSCPTGARKDLMQTLKDQLHTRRQDLLNNTTELQYKQACVDYLRSLVINRAASCSNTYYNLDSRNNIISSANTHIESASIDVDGADYQSDASAPSSDPLNTWLGQAHKSCTISSSGFTEDNTNKSVYLQRLERMERKHLAPVFGNGAQYSTGFEGDYSNDNEDEVSGDMSVSGIVVKNIQYMVHPTTQLYCVEVSITLTNNFAHKLYCVKASALLPHNSHNSTNIHTTSGVVDCLLPNATATIVAQFTLPQNVFAVNGSVEICINIALNWRECAIYWTQNDVESDGLSEHSRILSGLTKSRSLGRIVGAVHLNMQDFFASHTVRTPGQVLHLEDARWQRYMIHKRQDELQHSPYCVAMPCDSATYMTMRGSTNAPNKIFSCVPSVEVTLANKSLSKQALDAATKLSYVQKSLFSMDKVLQDLHRRAHSSELTASIGEQQEYTVHTGNRCSLVLPAVVNSSVEKSVQCTGTLYAPRICTNLSVTAMGEALLRLRQLLPTEIQVHVELPIVQKRYAVRHAAMCLLEEFKIFAVATRLRCEKERKIHTRDAQTNTASSEDDTAMTTVLNWRAYLAKLESDQAIAFMFSVLHL